MYDCRNRSQKINSPKVINNNWRKQSRQTIFLVFLIITYAENFISVFAKKDKINMMHIYFGKLYFQHKIEV